MAGDDPGTDSLQGNLRIEGDTMARRNQFTVSAESVQGNEGAEVTFKRLLYAKHQRYFDLNDDYGPAELLRDHILDWKGIEDDNGNEIPSPKDEPVEAHLYVGEIKALSNLLFQGPDGEHAKN